MQNCEGKQRARKLVNSQPYLGIVRVVGPGLHADADYLCFCSVICLEIGEVTH